AVSANAATPPAAPLGMPGLSWPRMRLLIVRHAEAAPGTPDELRTLTPGGREQARLLGEELRRDGLAADAVLCSPLLRARDRAGARPRRRGGRRATRARCDGVRPARHRSRARRCRRRRRSPAGLQS